MKREKQTHIILEDGNLIKGPISDILTFIKEMLEGKGGHWHEMTLLSPDLKPERKQKPKKRKAN